MRNFVLSVLVIITSTLSQPVDENLLMSPAVSIWKNPDRDSVLYHRYAEMFFGSVEPLKPGSEQLEAYFVQYPTVKPGTIYSFPKEFMRNFSPVDFYNLQTKVYDPFKQLWRHEDQLAQAEWLAVNKSDFFASQQMMGAELQNVFSMPRNSRTHPAKREAVGGFIYQKMGRMGLIVAMQDYNHELPITKYLEARGESMRPLYEEGTNIIGILPGKHFHTARDRPIIVGAHWDVVANTSGYNDNGSGVAAMLETARVIAQAVHRSDGQGCLDKGFDYSVIFVAFDSEEPGCFGSQEFIRRFVMPRVVRKGAKIRAVFILDTILNVDFTENSQDIDDSWRLAIPETVSSIETEGSKGDFIAVMGREKAGDAKLAKIFQSHFSPEEFKLRPFSLKGLPGDNGDRFPTNEELVDHSFFWLSDNSRFWFYREGASGHYSFPAITLTDTAFRRGYMRECYHSACDEAANQNLTEVNYNFLTQITQALIYSVVELMNEDKDVCELPYYEVKTTTTTTTTTTETTTKKIPVEPLLELQKVEEECNEVDGGECFNDDDNRDFQSNSAVVASSSSQMRRVPASASVLGRHSPSPPVSTAAAGEMGFFRSGDSSPVTYNVGTQINIGTLNIQLGTSNPTEGQQQQEEKKKETFLDIDDDEEDEERPNVILGSGDVDPSLLSKIIYNYYNSLEQEEEVDEDVNSVDYGDGEESSVHDRRKYKGKHKNSPMIIKLMKQTS